jgi:hypothetical protein
MKKFFLNNHHLTADRENLPVDWTYEIFSAIICVIHAWMEVWQQSMSLAYNTHIRNGENVCGSSLVLHASAAAMCFTASSYFTHHRSAPHILCICTEVNALK